jgi:glutamate/tyrosine decarboxylase-like PLP-dependent enzyme
VCLFRERGLLETHLAEVADYLYQADDPSLDPGLASLQCGRRNDALKVWAAWKYLGDDGYAARIENLMEMAASAANKVEQTPGLKLIRQPASINVCFTVDGVDAATMCQALHDSERALIGFASVDGEPVLRLAVAAPMAPEVLDTLLTSVTKTAHELRRGNKENHGT